MKVLMMSFLLAAFRRISVFQLFTIRIGAKKALKSFNNEGFQREVSQCFIYSDLLTGNFESRTFRL